MEEKNQSSGGRTGIVGLVRANLAQTTGLKITPAQREYYRYTGISAEVEKHGILNPTDRDFSRLPRVHKPVDSHNLPELK